MNALPRRARLLVLAVCVLGALALGWAALTRAFAAPAPSWELLVYVVLALVAGGRKIQVIGRSREEESGSLSLGIAIIFAAILRGGPHAGLIAAMASCLSSCLYPKRQSAVQLVFNLSLTAVQSWLSGLTYVWLNGGTLAVNPFISLPAAASASIVYFAVNSAGLSGIIGLCSGQSPLTLWKDTAIQTGPIFLAAAAIIGLTVVMSQGRVGVVLLFGAPVAALVYHSFATSTLLGREKQLRIEQLQQSESRLSQLYEKARLQAGQQRALTHVGLLALSELAAECWMQHAVEAIGRTLNAEHVALLELQPASSSLLLRAGTGWPEGEVGRAKVPTGLASMGGYVLLNRGPVVVEDFAQEQRFEAGPLLSRAGIASGLAVIVMSGAGSPWGVLGIYSRYPCTYDGDVRDFLQSMAHLIALALDRYRHAQLLEERSEEIGALNARLQRAMAETHHRVKNNLQLISGLIDMEATDHSDNVPTTELRRLGQHVCGLAAIHDLLTFQAKGGGQVEHISTRAAFDKLLPLVRSVTGARILHCEVADALLPVHKSTSLTILVNELVCNAVKHGSTEIDIVFAVDRQTARLEVSDDGPGFPEGFCADQPGHVGLELVESLSRWDLQGTSLYANRPGGGAQVVVTFPVDRPRRGSRRTDPPQAGPPGVSA